MSYLLVRHKVKDYATWKKAFDSTEELRNSYGIKGGWILHDESDRNDIFVALEVESLNRAHEFINSPEIKDAIKRAGVIDTPDIRYLETADIVGEVTPSRSSYSASVEEYPED